MFAALILLALIAAIILASRRWPEVERALWPEEAGPIPRERTAEPAPVRAEPKPHAVHKTTATTKAGMRTKAIEVEPEIETPPPARRRDPEPAAPVAEPTVEPDQESPGGHVTGQPARPSQPAYYDATHHGKEGQSVDDLARQADEAYRQRNYAAAEQACLKILMKEPRNHKYMTRIGQVYQEMGQLEDAKEAFEAAKKLDPKNFFVLNRLTEVTRLLEEKSAK